MPENPMDAIERFMEMSDCTDEDLLCLPHPVRLAACGIQEITKTLIGERSYRRMVKMIQLSYPTEMILGEMNKDSEFSSLLEVGGMAPGVTNFGIIDSFLPVLTHENRGSAVFQITDNLEGILEKSSLSTVSSVKYLSPPQPEVFIEFGSSRISSLHLRNDLSGDHILEGVYVFERKLSAGSELLVNNEQRMNGLNLDERKATRTLELVFTGSPVGKKGVLDDCTQHIQLFIQDEEMCVHDLLKQHFDYYRNMNVEGIKPLSEVDAEIYKRVLGHLMKTLLFLRSEPSCHVNREKSELSRKLRGAGWKKRAKITERLLKSYDRILVDVPSSKIPSNGNSIDVNGLH